MKVYTDEILENAKVLLDLVTPYLLLIIMNCDKGMYEDATQYGLAFLDILGVKIDQNESMALSDLMQTKTLIESSIETVLEMGKMEDKIASSMEILNSIAFSCFNAAKHHLFASVSSKMVLLTLNHGLSKYSSVAFALFAMVLCTVGDKSSYEIGKLSLKLLEKAKAKEMIPVVNCLFFGYVSPFYAQIHSSLGPLRDAACASLGIGNHHYR